MKIDKPTQINLIYYITGFIFIGLGVNMIVSSTLGAGAFDALMYNLSQLVNITLGTASAIVTISLMVFVLLYHKNWKYFALLIPIFGVALMIDLWYFLVFTHVNPTFWVIQGLLFLSGFFVLTLGAASVISTRYPALVFEETTFTLMRIFKSESFIITRVILETSAVMLALVLGYFAGIGFGAVDFGTLFLALAIGPSIAQQVRLVLKFRHIKTL